MRMNVSVGPAISGVRANWNASLTLRVLATDSAKTTALVSVTRVFAETIVMNKTPYSIVLLEIPFRVIPACLVLLTFWDTVWMPSRGTPQFELSLSSSRRVIPFKRASTRYSKSLMEFHAPESRTQRPSFQPSPSRVVKTFELTAAHRLVCPVDIRTSTCPPVRSTPWPWKKAFSRNVISTHPS